MGPRVVPWRDWDEWEAVRVGLTGDDPGSRDVALRSVDAWRTRGWVPHAVDVTAQLMEARMHDRGVPGSPGAFDRVDPTTVDVSPPPHRSCSGRRSATSGGCRESPRFSMLLPHPRPRRPQLSLRRHHHHHYDDHSRVRTSRLVSSGLLPNRAARLGHHAATRVRHGARPTPVPRSGRAANPFEEVSETLPAPPWLFGWRHPFAGWDASRARSRIPSPDDSFRDPQRDSASCGW